MTSGCLQCASHSFLLEDQLRSIKNHEQKNPN
jgi:hypothetical protein